jgi:hypothetical protein
LEELCCAVLCRAVCFFRKGEPALDNLLFAEEYLLELFFRVEAMRSRRIEDSSVDFFLLIKDDCGILGKDRCRFAAFVEDHSIIAP